MIATVAFALGLACPAGLPAPAGLRAPVLEAAWVQRVPIPGDEQKPKLRDGPEDAGAAAHPAPA